MSLLVGTAMLIPTMAQAQDRGRDRGDRGGGDRSFNWQGGGGQPGGPALQRQRESRGGDPAAREAMARGRDAARAVERPAPPPQAPAAQEPRRQWQGGSRGGDGDRAVIARGRNEGADRSRDWNRGNDSSQRDGGRDGGRRGGWDRDDRPDNPPRATSRDGNRDGRNWDRSWTSDRNRWNGSRDDGRWDRGWRNDGRYAWQDYRNRNRQIYRLPRYNPPRWGYSYRRWSPGVRWDSWYYGSSYWIADPWFYRLPPAYGDLRWVRYYDDAVLVDIRTGEIVDIIHSFFF